MRAALHCRMGLLAAAILLPGCRTTTRSVTGLAPLAPVAVSLARTDQKPRKADPVLVEMLTFPLKLLLLPFAMSFGM